MASIQPALAQQGVAPDKQVEGALRQIDVIDGHPADDRLVRCAAQAYLRHGADARYARPHVEEVAMFLSPDRVDAIGAPPR